MLKLCLVLGQNSEGLYPPGIYDTFGDFVARTPGTAGAITAKQGKNIIITTFRLRDGAGNKIKDAFAACDGQNLYVRTHAMMEHLTNVEFNKPNATHQDYSIAVLANSKYLYFEVFFQSKSVRTWGVGKVYVTGVLYDQSARKFTLLDTLEDLEGVPGDLEIPPGVEPGALVNGENIDVARKAIFRLFREP